MEDNTFDISEPKNQLRQMWNGYCPESWLKGKKVRMRINEWDFYESEETRLQICLWGVQAIILKFRGEGEFRSTLTYGDEIERSEMLSPQNTDQQPFNNPTVIFNDGEEIAAYIKSIE
jgi:hypothetical protein